MRNLALLLLLCCLPACSVSWEGQGSGVTSDQSSRDIVDVAGDAVTAEVVNTGTEANPQYRLVLAAKAYFTDLRRRQSGRANAFGRDLRSVGVFIDRHFFNYSPSDPYVNYESDTGYADHLLRFALTTVAR